MTVALTHDRDDVAKLLCRYVVARGASYTVVDVPACGPARATTYFCARPHRWIRWFAAQIGANFIAVETGRLNR